MRLAIKIPSFLTSAQLTVSLIVERGETAAIHITLIK